MLPESDITLIKNAVEDANKETLGPFRLTYEGKVGTNNEDGALKQLVEECIGQEPAPGNAVKDRLVSIKKVSVASKERQFRSVKLMALLTVLVPGE
jgi:hypothetical protein